MRYNQTALLVDLDGTLLNTRGEVSIADRQAIADYIAGGGLFAIATGREPRNARKSLPGLPLPGPAIVLNGTGIYDFGTDRYVTTFPIDMAAAADVVNRCLALGLPLDIHVYTPEGILYATPLEAAEPSFLQIHQPTAYAPMDKLLGMTWLKVLLLERVPGALIPMRAYLREQGYDKRLNLVEGTTDVVQVGLYQELLPIGVHKGTAVDALRQIEPFTGRTFFAMGDYWNDLEMLRAADVACAPKNAIPEIQAVCAHVLPSHNDSAAAYLIRELMPRL